VHDAARDDIRTRDDLPGLAVDADNDHQDAIARQRSPVADHHVADFSDRHPVNVDVTPLSIARSA
jgi:hypothetical protein